MIKLGRKKKKLQITPTLSNGPLRFFDSDAANMAVESYPTHKFCADNGCFHLGSRNHALEMTGCDKVPGFPTQPILHLEGLVVRFALQSLEKIDYT